jgi:hypothetical protein
VWQLWRVPPPPPPPPLLHLQVNKGKSKEEFRVVTFSIMSCCVLGSYFGRKYCLRLRGRRYNKAAICSPETLVTRYHIILRACVYMYMYMYIYIYIYIHI